MLAVIALAVRAGLAWGFQFDGLYGQDAYAFFEEGRQFAFPHPYTGPHSIGYPALLGLVSTLFGPSPWVAQGIGLLLGSLTPAVVFMLGWSLTGRRTIAWVASLIVCFIPTHVQRSVVVMSDVPAMFCLTAGTLSGVQYVQNQSWRWGVATVLFLTFATLIRYVSLLAVIPLIIYAVVSRHRPPWTHLLWGAVLGLIVFIPELLHMRFHVPALFLLQGWSPINAVRREFITLDGVLSYDWPVVLAYAKALAGWGFFNPVFAGFALAGVVALRAHRTTLAFLLAWILSLYGFLIGVPLVNPRYLLPLIVPISLLSAASLVDLWARVRQGTLGSRTVFCGVMCLGLIGLGLGNTRKMEEILTRKHCELQVVEWLDRHLPNGSLIIAFDVVHAARFYGHHQVIHLHEIDPTRLNIPAGSAPGVYLIWDEAQVARVAQRHVARYRSSSDDLMPQFTANYVWLRDRVQHTRLAQLCRWDIVRLNTKE